jgi:hypothetical protein
MTLRELFSIVSRTSNSISSTISNTSYHDYLIQAKKLRTEAFRLNADIEASQARDELREELDLELFGPPTDADGVDIVKARAAVKTISDTLAVCLDRIRTLMTGAVDDLKRLLETDAVEDLVVDRLYADNEDVRQHVGEGWKYLNEWERSLRLRLIHAFIVKEAVMEAQMGDLADTFGEMKVEELVNEDDWDDEALGLLETLNQAQDEINMECKLETLRLDYLTPGGSAHSTTSKQSIPCANIPCT